MQITVQDMHNGRVNTLTLRLVPAENESDNCPICSNVPPVWTIDLAAEEAMNPDITVIGASSCCNSCLNLLVSNGDVEITAIDPDSF